ncbi:MAG TPA: hypothetical protein VN853_18480, partial [Polyangia bacterium]|nr:hypothetical protein [Polyangia bacterium]
MLKKLAVPLFSLAIATFGCSSSTTPTGTGGTSGGTGGKSGTGGSSATGGAGGHAATGGAGGTTTATGGAGGHAATGGAGGATGGAGGGATATGGAGGAATGGAGGAPVDAGHSMADCTVTDMTGTDALSASVFCTNLFAYCSNVPGLTLTLPATEKACEDMYTQSGQEHCRSYHMCWGVEGISMDAATGNPKTHCPHTLGM